MDYFIIVRKPLSGGVPLFKKGRHWVKDPGIADVFTRSECYSKIWRLSRLPSNRYFYTFEMALPF